MLSDVVIYNNELSPKSPQLGCIKKSPKGLVYFSLDHINDMMFKFDIVSQCLITHESLLIRNCDLHFGVMQCFSATLGGVLSLIFLFPDEFFRHGWPFQVEVVGRLCDNCFTVFSLGNCHALWGFECCLRYPDEESLDSWESSLICQDSTSLMYLMWIVWVESS